MDESPLTEYRSRLEAGDIRPDPVQALAIEKLQSLHNALKNYTPDRDSKSWKDRLGLSRRREDPPQGLYMFGGVGRGKTMLMDLFFDTAQVAKKRRMHFHAFMQEVHLLMKVQRESSGRDSDPIPPVAKQMANEATLLCFDEMQVHDITDAMILRRLFCNLFEEGVVVVATSNRPPRDLYKDGLQRKQFMPFIELLEEKVDLLQLDGGVDYRLEAMRKLEVYLVPANAENEEKLEEAFEQLTQGLTAHTAVIPVQGRDVEIPKAVGGVALLQFEDLCGRPLGAADYLELVRRYHTLVVANIPKLDRDRPDLAKRFVTLIDAMYDAQVNLVCSADALPDELYTEGLGSFEFERTASRLVEMQTENYLQKWRSGERAA